MNPIRSFVGQPHKRYRNFQIVYSLLTLNFVIPAFVYTFFPGEAIDGFLEINRLLGGAPYPFAEGQSRIWRYLGAANVMTLGLMCLLLQVNLLRFWAVLWPLVFMKGYAALSWFFGWLATPQFPLFLAAALLDGVSCLAFVFFSRRALGEIRGVPPDSLIPRLRWQVRP